MESYINRETSITDIDQAIACDLTEVEKYLLEQQELMVVRGKVRNK